MPSIHERPYDAPNPNPAPELEMQNLDTEENAAPEAELPPHVEIDKENEADNMYTKEVEF